MTTDDAGDPPDGPKDAGYPGKGDISETLRQRLEALVPDLVRRTFTAGLGAVFSTEEGIRKITRELQLPTVAGNVAGYLADTADNTKDKVLEVVAREVRDALAHMNLADEIARLLTTLSFEIKTEIRFIPNSERFGGVDPDVKAAVRLKRSDRDGKEIKDPAPGGKEPREPRDPTRDANRDGIRDDDGQGPPGPGRLRRLWRRATEGGGVEEDELAGDDEIERDE